MTAPCPVSVVWLDDSPPTPCVLPHGHDGGHQYSVQRCGMSADPFIWRDNDEDEVRAECICGWFGPWREWIKNVRADERGHHCDRAMEWREAGHR